MSKLSEMLNTSRLAPLMERVESGQSLTMDEVNAAMILQQADLIQMGRMALSEAIERQEEADARAAALVGAEWKPQA